MGNEKLEKYIDQLFAKYDKDGNKVLDKDEASLLLKECLSTLKYAGSGDVTDDVIEKVWSLIDTDGNLVIDRMELTSFLAANCSQGISCL